MKIGDGSPTHQLTRSQINPADVQTDGAAASLLNENFCSVSNECRIQTEACALSTRQVSSRQVSSRQAMDSTDSQQSLSQLLRARGKNNQEIGDDDDYCFMADRTLSGDGQRSAGTTETDASVSKSDSQSDENDDYCYMGDPVYPTGDRLTKAERVEVEPILTDCADYLSKNSMPTAGPSNDPKFPR